MAELSAEAQQVLSYWFDAPLETEQEIGQRVGWWFRGGPGVDEEIRERFGRLVERAKRGELDAWAESARGRLGLILLLDQFTRNIDRGTPAAFDADRKAQGLVVEGIDAGLLAQLAGYFERMFFCMPLSHAEDLDLQRLAVRTAIRSARLATPAAKTVCARAYESACRHLDVIARFGRFPTRNAALGRESTPDEREYLDFCEAHGLFM